ncbi:MAG: dipeptide epimerase [Bacteroidales bacterium]
MENGISIVFRPYDLALRHPFGVAWGSRTRSPVVLTELTYKGVTGYGEASMPPYLGESVASVTGFLSKVDLSRFTNPLEINFIMDHVNSMATGNMAAKASIDIALHDLAGKLTGMPVWQMLGMDRSATPYSSMTIGIDSQDVVKKKVAEAAGFRILKVKLGAGNDREMINAVRAVSDKPLIADANQGWRDRDYALDTIEWLKEQNVILVEQPMPDVMEKDLGWLISRSPLPVFADEGVRTIDDLERRAGFYDGINIKLMKCGGIVNALQMIRIARENNMKILIGCMTETSCAVSAAAQLSPAADFADLDGNLLITNDCFHGMKLSDGRVTLDDLPGTGVKRL